MWVHTLCQTGLHALKQTEPLPWGSMGFIPDRGWCSEENQCSKVPGISMNRAGCGGGRWGRVSAEITLVGKDSRQGSSQCCSLRAGKRGHASGRTPGGGHGNSLQYSCLENPMDGGVWWAAVHRITKSRTELKWLSTAQHIPYYIIAH